MYHKKRYTKIIEYSSVYSVIHENAEHRENLNFSSDINIPSYEKNSQFLRVPGEKYVKKDRLNK